MPAGLMDKEEKSPPKEPNDPPVASILAVPSGSNADHLATSDIFWEDIIHHEEENKPNNTNFFISKFLSKKMFYFPPPRLDPPPPPEDPLLLLEDEP